ncbi:hypothetical protein [Xenorhabdus szentirmaii]|uniref:Uncharacterized protein n=1 Tax=Xenorhabdus szentirmaii DSM 16338 TaxID=1427518 RepID=W1IUV9_9GAMM|nr:hypothetical protein [Xenorhabdus szentirmaii]PHM35050.1 hypothetical protein Xsze_01503 [Xenorhabdus szentirmaii DSM 16338]PHM43845.1 hypothetical protein Xszus_03655 [Xenorhabdus szentirmaii]CDL82234.1 hypothetical protein XSR1_20061 [Xenorhabdus szentirmaii DSM 16338]
MAYGEIFPEFTNACRKFCENVEMLRKKRLEFKGNGDEAYSLEKIIGDVTSYIEGDVLKFKKSLFDTFNGMRHLSEKMDEQENTLRKQINSSSSSIQSIRRYSEDLLKSIKAMEKELEVEYKNNIQADARSIKNEMIDYVQRITPVYDKIHREANERNRGEIFSLSNYIIDRNNSIAGIFMSLFRGSKTPPTYMEDLLKTHRVKNTAINDEKGDVSELNISSNAPTHATAGLIVGIIGLIMTTLSVVIPLTQSIFRYNELSDIISNLESKLIDWNPTLMIAFKLKRSCKDLSDASYGISSEYMRTINKLKATNQQLMIKAQKIDDLLKENNWPRNKSKCEEYLDEFKKINTESGNMLFLSTLDKTLNIVQKFE